MTEPYGGVAPTGKAVEVRVMALWRFQDGLIQEIWTLQDQFAHLQPIGYFPEGVYEA